MQTNRSTDHSTDNRGGKLAEAMRFAVVGVVATVLQYVLYVGFNRLMHPTLANTIAYAVSFGFNYVASTRYTFKVKSTARRGLGFAFSHLGNYCMQTIVLAAMLWLGVQKDLAMVPVFAVCVPVNFILVRYFLKKR